ncbi:MAG: imelysin family protein [Anditalea sp.]
MKFKYLFFLLLMVTGFICLLPSCVEDEKNEKITLDRSPLLQSIADNVILPGYENLHIDVTEMEASIEQFLENPAPNTLDQTRSDFEKAYHSWQVVAFFEFGPAFTETLRANVNTFPTDYFSIENAVQSGEIDLNKLSSQNKKGFPALDYFFYGVGDTDETILEKFTTDPYSDHRKAYLAAVSEDLFAKVDKVYKEWMASGGNFRQTFIDKDGTDVGSSMGLMVNALSEYYERITRDARIGIPLGKRSQGVIIPQNAEAYYSGTSVSLATKNLDGIIDFFLGKNGQQDGEGLYDYLKSLNHEYEGELLADVLINNLEEAKSKVADIPSPFSESVKTNPQPAEIAHSQLQKTLILIKVDMASALGILISYQDNDGD